MLTYTLFTMPGCPDCVRAKELFEREGLSVVLRGDDDGQEPFTPDELINLVGPVRTLPQVVAHYNGDSYHVGGYRDLVKFVNGGDVQDLRKLG